MVSEEQVDAIIREAIQSYRLEPPRSDEILARILREIRREKEKPEDKTDKDGRDHDADHKRTSDSGHAGK